jgi:hypothetical protein
MKICRICKKNKKNKEFNKNRALEDQLQTYCRKCQKELNRKYYQQKKNKKIKSYEIEYKIPVTIKPNTMTATDKMLQKLHRKRYEQACTNYASKVFYDAQNEPQSLWERIKSLF